LRSRSTEDWPDQWLAHPQELSALVAYAKPFHMDVLGNQQSFGHFGRILSQPQYAALRETPDVLTPVREGTYTLLDDLYSEVCPLVPFPWFNVCCDETDGLGTGPARDLVSSIGVGASMCATSGVFTTCSATTTTSA